MKAVRLTTAGDQTSLELRGEPLPNPGRHEVLVQVHAASLNFRDQAVLNGPYGAANKKSIIPLLDGAGKVVAVGEDVTRVKVGHRVAVNCFVHWVSGPFLPDYYASSVGFSIDGMLAEYARLHENALVHLPAYKSYIEAVSLPCAAVVIWSSLNLATPLQPDFADIMFGARVLAITSSDEKAKKLKGLGAESVVNDNTFPDWDREILTLTDGRGVDKVIVIAGDKTIIKSAASAKIRGEIALVGSASGLGGGLPPVDMLYRSFIVGTGTIGSRTNFKALLKAMAMHEVRPVIDRVYPFSEYREAYRRIESGKHIGKVVIDVAN